MRALISLLIITSSTCAYAWDSQSVTIESRLQKLDSQLDKKGVAVLCVDGDSGDQSEKLSDILNSTLALLKVDVAVSQPSLQNAGYRYTALCVTVTKK